MDESPDQSHTNTLNLMPCEEGAADAEGGISETEDGKCRVSIHYEGEGDKNGVEAKTGVL